MNVDLRDHVQMHVRRSTFAIIVGAIAGCTAHAVPSAAPAQLPFAGLSVSPMKPRYGGMRLFDDQSRAVRLSNFDLSELEPSDIASPLNLDARVATLAEFVRYRQRGWEEGAISLP